MKLRDGDFIKQMREIAEMSQEDMAEQLNLSRSQVARLESGASSIDIWQFIALTELAGVPTQDFWVLHLETKEFDDYRKFKKLKNLILADEHDEAKLALQKLKDKPNKKHKSVYLRQYIALAEVMLNKTGDPKENMQKLDDIIHMTKPNFDESQADTARLTYNESSALIEKAHFLFESEKHDEAINLLKSLIKRHDTVSLNEEDKAYILPAVMSNLSTMLGRLKRYKESKEYCLQGIKVCEEFQEFRLIPVLHYNLASCLRFLKEERQVYTTHIVRAYYGARLMNQHELAEKIKAAAENPEKFNMQLPF